MTKHRPKKQHCLNQKHDQTSPSPPFYWGGGADISGYSFFITYSLAPHYFPYFLDKIIKLSNDRITSLLDSIHSRKKNPASLTPSQNYLTWSQIPQILSNPLVLRLTPCCTDPINQTFFLLALFSKSMTDRLQQCFQIGECTN